MLEAAILLGGGERLPWLQRANHSVGRRGQHAGRSRLTDADLRSVGFSSKIEQGCPKSGWNCHILSRKMKHEGEIEFSPATLVNKSVFIIKLCIHVVAFLFSFVARDFSNVKIVTWLGSVNL